MQCSACLSISALLRASCKFSVHGLDGLDGLVPCSVKCKASHLIGGNFASGHDFRGRSPPVSDWPAFLVSRLTSSNRRFALSPPVAQHCLTSTLELMRLMASLVMHLPNSICRSPKWQPNSRFRMLHPIFAWVSNLSWTGGSTVYGREFGHICHSFPPSVTALSTDTTRQAQLCSPQPFQRQIQDIP